MAQILLLEGAAQATPPANYVTVYAKVDGLLYAKMPSGVEYPLGASGGTGTVTTVSVVTANGFAGTVATPSTTPAITITTGVSGIIKGVAGSLVAAVANTDYVPSTAGLPSGVLFSTTGTGVFSIATNAQLPVMTNIFGGAVPTPPNNTTTFLRGDGVFAVPSGVGFGSVTSVSVVTANGVSGSVATPTTTPAITLTLGAITPTSVNGITFTGTAATTMTFPEVSADIGFRNIPQNSQSAAYTTVLADSGKHIYHPSADVTARIWTIDSNTNVPYAIGTAITFVNDTSAGVITISITADTLVLAGAGTTGSRTLAAGNEATALKVATNRWMISGSSGLT